MDAYLQVRMILLNLAGVRKSNLVRTPFPKFLGKCEGVLASAIAAPFKEIIRMML
jgi:hypothetical protein